MKEQAPVGDSVDELAKDCDYYMTSGERPPESFYRQVRAQLVNITAWKDAQLARERQESVAPAKIVPSFKCSLASTDAYDPQSFINGAKWAQDKLLAAPAAQAQGEPVAWREWVQETVRLFGSMRIAMHWPDLESHLKEMEAKGTAMLSTAAPQPDEVRDAVLEEAAKWHDHMQAKTSGTRSAHVHAESARHFRALKRTYAADNQKGGEA